MVTIGEIRKFVRGADSISAYLVGGQITISVLRGDTTTYLYVDMKKGPQVGDILHSIHTRYLTRPYSCEFGVVMTKKQ